MEGRETLEQECKLLLSQVHYLFVENPMLLQLVSFLKELIHSIIFIEVTLTVNLRFTMQKKSSPKSLKDNGNSNFAQEQQRDRARVGEDEKICGKFNASLLSV